MVLGGFVGGFGWFRVLVTTPFSDERHTVVDIHDEICCANKLSLVIFISEFPLLQLYHCWFILLKLNFLIV